MDNNPVFSNIIEAWLAAETATPGRTLAEALADLNDETGLKADHSHLSKWRLGKRTPPPEALQHMARIAAHEILLPYCGPLDDHELDAIAAAFTPPVRRTNSQ